MESGFNGILTNVKNRGDPVFLVWKFWERSTRIYEFWNKKHWESQ